MYTLLSLLFVIFDNVIINTISYLMKSIFITNSVELKIHITSD